MILLPLNIPVWKISRRHWNHEIQCKIHSQFKKDLKLAKKQNKNIDKLYAVIETLAEGNTLDPKFKDHELMETTKVQEMSYRTGLVADLRNSKRHSGSDAFKTRYSFRTV